MKKNTPSFTDSCKVCVRVNGASSKRRLRSTESLGRPEIAAQLHLLKEDIQQRIASDLHDSTCQHLVAASLSLLRLKQLANNAGPTEKIYEEIDASINHALREIRAYSYLLYPQDVLDVGLKRTIEGYVSGFCARTSLKSVVDITPDVRKLTCETQCSLLRLVQEALTNVFRHASATRVKISIEARSNALRFRVIDNGRGIPLGGSMSGPKAISLGVGIRGMKSRVQQLGGSFEIRSSTGSRHGTTVCALLPYHRSKELPLYRHHNDPRRLLPSG